MKSKIQKEIYTLIPCIVAGMMVPLGIYRFGMHGWQLFGIVVVSFACGVISHKISKGG